MSVFLRIRCNSFLWIFRVIQVVLVREVCVAAATVDGYVWELPGGSSPDEDVSPLAVAEEECVEETGLKVDQSRLSLVGSRQLAATSLTHKAHVFAARLTGDELAELQRIRGLARGVVEDTERTFVEVVPVSRLLEIPVDWSTLGMILFALHGLK